MPQSENLGKRPTLPRLLLHGLGLLSPPESRSKYVEEGASGWAQIVR